MTAHPRFSLNQATVKYASLAEAIVATKSAGIQAIGTWREPVAEIGLDAATRLIADSGLRVSSHCRAGFFTAPDGPERVASLDDNRRAIDETAALAAAGAPGSAAVLVLVSGALPGGDRDLIGARERVRDALGDLEPYAASAGVTLAVEALHPMFAADRCVVSTLGQAIDLAVDAGPSVGVVVDTYHVWWDPDVLAQIARAGSLGRIASYQVCDWLTPLPADVLLGRGIPGDGHIDFGPITRAVEAAGYTGDIECEIFNEDVWARPHDDVAAAVSAAFTSVVAPHL
ncbi:sugar phosphate isomerase/epimerase family protein [Humibacter ginsenosidimutans]|uniref:Sugar phosphate isomerase/epimerase n=1 Tax=Humibacter ginsenosidimutans TaxID=2599293 RepID=A0A5B8M613_9MICO|nr:sugar phosphate isomerase/epimerase family protein [Humibacter ginsenosidimutans]QDZ16238.1 sugar phosphate isomerase/epimerase [Humibacter ginsenosidimutans]